MRLFKKRKTQCGLKSGSCKDCWNARCEGCGTKQPRCSPYLYKVYTGKNGNHIFCMACLAKYLIENIKPEYNGETWSLINDYHLKDIVRLDKELKNKDWCE